MKKIAQTLCQSIMIASAVSLSGNIYAGMMGETTVNLSPGQFYIGVFGGGGGATSDTLAQLGSAYYSSTAGGPLAVNAFGNSSVSGAWLAGLNVGYQWSPILFNKTQSNWTLSPAIEIEGYDVGNTITAVELNNETARLTEHDFHAGYPMNTGVFLVNGLLSLNHSLFNTVHPYLGVGAGTAMISITNAHSDQTAPAEPGINHYNSDPNASTVAFAVQPKIGLHFDINQHGSIFVEYRFLYISPTDYTFGSTVYPSHVATSSWNVKMGAMLYNFGTVGIRFNS